ncbi:hypothetical protein D6827_04025 [Candidatus Parcubacteria bacterium]|nr:MAG: hypothetical protein D6827_04025 [Candidatus Parcubacteria bacterium]
MKKIFNILILFILAGAGCVSLDSGNRIPDNWNLSFAAPEGWVAVPAYSEASEFIDLQGVSSDTQEIYLQSAPTQMVFGKKMPDEEDGQLEIQTDDMIRISVLPLSARRHLPDEAEDLGNGFYKVKACEADECKDGRHDYDYYYEAPSGDKYLFRIWLKGRDISEAEKVIFSAKENK